MICTYNEIRRASLCNYSKAWLLGYFVPLVLIRVDYTIFYNNIFTTMRNRTFAIIKPDAVEKGAMGDIIKTIEDDGLRIIAIKMVFLSRYDAERFYAVHRGKPFYDALCLFMSSGPIVVMTLQNNASGILDEPAYEQFRKLIGSTDPAKAEIGTIRNKYGTSITMNAIHGSDSENNGEIESAFFFDEHELIDSRFKLSVEVE